MRRNNGQRMETIHIQSQRARLWITLQQGIQNNFAPLETIPCLPPTWPPWLGTAGALAGFPASSLSLALARQASGSLCGHYWASHWSCQALVKDCRGHFEVLPNIWAYGWEVGLFQCALNLLFPPDLIYPHWFIIVFQNRGKKNRKHFFWPATKGVLT